MLSIKFIGVLYLISKENRDRYFYKIGYNQSNLASNKNVFLMYTYNKTVTELAADKMFFENYCKRLVTLYRIVRKFAIVRDVTDTLFLFLSICLYELTLKLLNGYYSVLILCLYIFYLYRYLKTDLQFLPY